MQSQKDKEEKEKEWRRRRGELPESGDEDEKSEGSSEEESSGDEQEGTAAKGATAKPQTSRPKPPVEESSSEEESSDDGEPRRKGAEGLIDIQNPNRVQQKMKKVSNLTHDDAKPQLSRREREELEKQRAKAHYQKLHAQGKTEEARADLARLAIIRKQREEAAKKREEERLGKNLKFLFTSRPLDYSKNQYLCGANCISPLTFNSSKGKRRQVEAN